MRPRTRTGAVLLLGATGMSLEAVLAGSCVPTPTLIEDDGAPGAAASAADGGEAAADAHVDAATDSGPDAFDAGEDASDGAMEAGWIYSVVVGTGVQGFSGDDAGATMAEIGTVSGIAKDAAGNLYFSDSGNVRIRRVDAASNVITTYGGTGTPGYTGDNGPAVAATLNGPSGLVVDRAGNVYFAEFNNKDIREIDTNGTITTYVSLPDRPTGLAIDGQGDFYVAMFALGEILKVDTMKNVTVVAGPGVPGTLGDNGPATSASFDNPNGVWVDPNGNLYIVDCFHYRIRKVDTGGTITTIAGDGTAGYSGDEGPATAAKIDTLYGVAADAAGNVYFGNDAYHVVRHVDPGGTIHTIAGTGVKGTTLASKPALQAALTNPEWLMMDGQGSLYFAGLDFLIARLGR